MPQQTPTPPPTFNPNYNWQTNVGSINSGNLAPQNDIQYATPQMTPISGAPLPSTDLPAMTATAPEQKANDLTSQLEDLNNQLTGRSAYQTQQEAAQGLPALQATQKDLTARASALSNEALQIPLQLQQQATGRGITAAGLAPIQTAALRNNAIQSLSVNSLLQASQGNITYAQSLADKAVAQKYDPIQEQITAATKNLQLVLNSPEYSLADKNRAQQQLNIQNQKQQQLDQAKQNAQAINNIALDAAKNGADSATLQKISSAANPNDALQIAAAGGFIKTPVTPQALPASIQEYEYAKKNGYTGTFSQYQNEDANRKAVVAKAGASTSYSGSGAPGTLSTVGQAWLDAVKNGNATMTNVPNDYKNEVALGLARTDTASYSPLAASRFAVASNRIVSNFTNLPQYQLTANGLPYLQRIDAAIKTPGSVSDQDLLDSLTKLNTAGNAITDAQVNLITKGRSFSDAMSVYANRLSTGGVLSDTQRTQIQQIAKAVYANYAKGYQPVYDQVTKQLQDAGIPAAFWTIPDLNNLSQQGGYGDISGGSPTSAMTTPTAGGTIVTAPDGQQIQIID